MSRTPSLEQKPRGMTVKELLSFLIQYSDHEHIVTIEAPWGDSQALMFYPDPAGFLHIRADFQQAKDLGEVR